VLALGIALDVPVVSDFRFIQLYELIYRGALTLLGFSERASRISTASVLSALCQFNRADMITFVVSTESRREQTSSTLYDLNEEALNDPQPR
jgi:hypothetical protein